MTISIQAWVDLIEHPAIFAVCHHLAMVNRFCEFLFNLLAALGLAGSSLNRVACRGDFIELCARLTGGHDVTGLDGLFEFRHHLAARLGSSHGLRRRVKARIDLVELHAGLSTTKHVAAGNGLEELCTDLLTRLGSGRIRSECGCCGQREYEECGLEFYDVVPFEMIELRLS